MLIISCFYDAPPSEISYVISPYTIIALGTAPHAYALYTFHQISISSGSGSSVARWKAFSRLLSYFFGKIEPFTDMMRFRKCIEPCDRFITTGDTHDRCVLCLGRNHAQAAFSGLFNYQHCDSLRLKAFPCSSSEARPSFGEFGWTAQRYLPLSMRPLDSDLNCPTTYCASGSFRPGPQGEHLLRKKGFK